MDRERRKSLRIKRSLTVQYGYLLDKDRIKWDMTAIKDINQTGLCISTEKCFPPNEIIYFRIKFPNVPFKSFEFKGKVIESKAGGLVTRIEFLDLNEDQKAPLQEYAKWFLSTNKREGIDEL